MAGVKGAASLRRLLRRLPDASRDALGNELQAIGNRLLARAKAETPVKTGRLKAALAVRVAVKSLQLRLGLIKKQDKRRLFYGYILDQGRKGKSGISKSGRKFNITPIPSNRYEFVFGRRKDFQVNEVPKLRSVLDQVLTQAARGAGDD